jgi:hypothetical protein
MFFRCEQGLLLKVSQGACVQAGSAIFAPAFSTFQIVFCHCGLIRPGLIRDPQSMTVLAKSMVSGHAQDDRGYVIALQSEE